MSLRSDGDKCGREPYNKQSLNDDATALNNGYIVEIKMHVELMVQGSGPVHCYPAGRFGALCTASTRILRAHRETLLQLIAPQESSCVFNRETKVKCSWSAPASVFGARSSPAAPHTIL